MSKDGQIVAIKTAIWAEDPELNLTEKELDEVLELFGQTVAPDEQALRARLQQIFRMFMSSAKNERFREKDGQLKKISKTETVISRDLRRIADAFERLEKALEGADLATRDWLNRYFKECRVTGADDTALRFQKFKETLHAQADLVAHATRLTEGTTSRGPDNAALKELVHALATCWEELHGSAPKTDRARGQQEDPFLELCQKFANIAHLRLKKRGGGLSTLALSGLVSDVLKSRRSQKRRILQEK